MSIFVPEPTSERGRGDAKRHRDKQKEVLKENLPKVIAEESIITGGQGKVKIPIRRLSIPDFRPGKSDGGDVGVGQGDGAEGEILGKRPGKGKPGQAGEEPGEDYIDTEIEIAEILELMFEDLGLPSLEEKQVKELVVELGWKIRGTSKSGPWPLLNTKRTVQEGMKRFWFLFEALKSETGIGELICFSALKKADGIFSEALLLLQNAVLLPIETEVVPFPILHTDDLRFHNIQPDVQYQSQAVVIAMMDVSGSMSQEKKYLARSMLFWLVRFLEKIYEKVVIRFIIHHTNAKNVEEDVFFKTGESGGTYCYTAYELAGSLIDTEYPPAQWNVYAWHFSDGEDFSTDRTVEELKKLFARKINMFGYGELRVGETWRLLHSLSDSELFTAFSKAFAVEKTEVDGVRVMTGTDEPLLGIVITRKEHIFPAIKQFLKKDRWMTHA
ncbi:MAG: DUF444 family protein [Parcubacteria group bacterium]|nr:DUF444 family protein [Parcubacteria group bacterium]